MPVREAQPIAARRTEERVDPREVRKTILWILYHGATSHLGPSMSLVEILIAIYGAVDCQKIRLKDPDRDRVIISKGHGAAAVYAVLRHYGVISSEELETYCQNGSRLAGHVSHAVPGVEHSTGALGHGPSVAVGCALGLRARGLPATVHCVVGDGEMQEGSVWEAVMLAGHHQLSNFLLYVDDNRMSSIGWTRDSVDVTPLEEKLRAFRFDVCRVDGHDVAGITEAIRRAGRSRRPTAILCDTVKGRGVPFAEHNNLWHYRSLNADTYAQALKALEDGAAS